MPSDLFTVRSLEKKTCNVAMDFYKLLLVEKSVDIPLNLKKNTLVVFSP